LVEEKELLSQELQITIYKQPILKWRFFNTPADPIFQFVFIFYIRNYNYKIIYGWRCYDIMLHSFFLL